MVLRFTASPKQTLKLFTFQFWSYAFKRIFGVP